MGMLRILWVGRLGVALAAMTGWGVLAIYYSDIASTPLRAGLAGAFELSGATNVASLVLARWRWHALAGFCCYFCDARRFGEPHRAL